MGALPPGHIDQYGNQEFAFDDNSSESSSAPPVQAGQQVNIEVKKNKGRRRRLPALPLHKIDFEMSGDDNSSSEGPRTPFVQLPRRDRLRRAFKRPAQNSFSWKYLVVPVAFLSVSVLAWKVFL